MLNLLYQQQVFLDLVMKLNIRNSYSFLPKTKIILSASHKNLTRNPNFLVYFFYIFTFLAASGFKFTTIKHPAANFGTRFGDLHGLTSSLSTSKFFSLLLWDLQLALFEPILLGSKPLFSFNGLNVFSFSVPDFRLVQAMSNIELIRASSQLGFNQTFIFKKLLLQKIPIAQLILSSFIHLT